MNSVCQEAQTRARAAALMRTKITTVARFAINARPVCPRVTRGITARIMMAVAPAVSAWMAEATGTPMLKIESPRSRTPSTSQAYPTWRMISSFSAHVAKPVQRLSRAALSKAAAIRSAPVDAMIGEKRPNNQRGSKHADRRRYRACSGVREDEDFCA